MTIKDTDGRVQLGGSVTPANNFVLDASGNDGTMRLARGNAGATTQDILTVDTGGKVAVPTGLLGFNFSLTSNGYIQFPSWCFGGIVLQWGYVVSSGTAAGNAAVTFAIPFPTACLQAVASVTGGGSTANVTVQIGTLANATMSMSALNNAVITSGLGVRYLAIGY